MQSLAGVTSFLDNINIFSHEMQGSTALIERARDYAYEKMKYEAVNRGANAVIAIDTDNTIGGEIMYLCLYGTAVLVEPIGTDGE